MMVIMKSGHSQEEMDQILSRLDEVGLKGHPIVGVERTVIAVVGSENPLTPHLGTGHQTAGHLRLLLGDISHGYFLHNKPPGTQVEFFGYSLEALHSPACRACQRW